MANFLRWFVVQILKRRSEYESIHLSLQDKYVKQIMILPKYGELFFTFPAKFKLFRDLKHQLTSPKKIPEQERVSYCNTFTEISSRNVSRKVTNEFSTYSKKNT